MEICAESHRLTDVANEYGLNSFAYDDFGLQYLCIIWIGAIES